MVAFLENKLWFPDPRHYGEYMDNGLLAVGGEMSVERLKLAYRMGIFPWTDRPVTWWCPDPRGIIDLNNVRISRSLARARRKGVFRCTMNQSFEEVVTACAKTPRPGSWITEPFIRGYLRMHQAGYAHSVECWQEDVLVGGNIWRRDGGAICRGIDVLSSQQRFQNSLAAFSGSLACQGLSTF